VVQGFFRLKFRFLGLLGCTRAFVGWYTMMPIRSDYNVRHSFLPVCFGFTKTHVRACVRVCVRACGSSRPSLVGTGGWLQLKGTTVRTAYVVCECVEPSGLD